MQCRINNLADVVGPPGVYTLPEGDDKTGRAALKNRRLFASMPDIPHILVAFNRTFEVLKSFQDWLYEEVLEALIAPLRY